MRVLFLCLLLALSVVWMISIHKTDMPADRVFFLPPVSREALHPDQILHWTNHFRISQNLPALRKNDLLMQAARLRAEDMADKGYFAHSSPSGEGPAEAAAQTGYSFINISENIAKGNFLDNKELVQGWIDSPGHQANMVDARMQEIGVAVIRDDSGRQAAYPMYISVQLFGRDDSALAACVAPHPTEQEYLEKTKAQLEVLADSAKRMHSEVEALNRTIQAQGDPLQRQEFIQKFNSKVTQYNALIEEIKDYQAVLTLTVEAFNTRVNAYNACLNAALR